ncbi:MAG: GNAT family N-acetyltransferase [Alphaproteobacteria bacterium]
MSFKIIEVSIPEEKSLIVTSIMHSLPDWFYLEETIIKYQEEVKPLPFFAAFNEKNEAVGMMCLIDFKAPDIESIEIKVIGVKPEYHKQKIGYALINKASEFAKEHQKRYLTVKTLSSKNPDVFYQKTREFYKHCGFISLMDIVELWDDVNPCLLMVKDLYI